jgi:hypothetical protein
MCMKSIFCRCNYRYWHYSNTDLTDKLQYITQDTEYHGCYFLHEEFLFRLTNLSPFSPKVR